MKAMNAKVRSTVWKEIAEIFRNGVIFRNPVLIGALGLFPVATGSFQLKNGVALSVMMFVMMLPVCVISGLIKKRIPSWARPGVILFLSALFYIPAQMLAGLWVPQASLSLLLCAPMMICNSIILSRANDYAPEHILPATIADALGCTIGFSLVTCLFSAIRELLTAGTLWGDAPSNQIVSQPFFGFLMLGFFAAAVQAVNRSRSRKAKRKGGRIK